MLLTTIAYNLKKLLQHQPKRVVRVALACQLGLHQLALGLFFGFMRATYLSGNCAGGESRRAAEFCNSHERNL